MLQSVARARLAIAEGRLTAALLTPGSTAPNAPNGSAVNRQTRSTGEPLSPRPVTDCERPISLCATPMGTFDKQLARPHSRSLATVLEPAANPSASARVTSAAGTARQPLTFCPAHSGE